MATTVHVLDWALPDESTPHIHERHVFDCENKYGEVAPQQEKALEVQAGQPARPGTSHSAAWPQQSQRHFRCRLPEDAVRDCQAARAGFGGRCGVRQPQYLEKQDFILAKQKEQLAAQQSKLDELTSFGHGNPCWKMFRLWPTTRLWRS